MRRDFRSELIAAVAAIALLAFAITFGILLSVSDDEPAGDNIPTVPVEQTQEVTQEVIATATDELADTATDEPTPTDANTDEPTATSTRTSTATETEAPTQTATATDEPTATATNTDKPTATFTRTSTATETEAPTQTATATSTSTKTPRPSRTFTLAPTATSTPEPCRVRTDWPVYIVQSGNTLFLIAQAVGSTVAELGEANCLENVNYIEVGDEIRVPRLPTKPVDIFTLHNDTTMNVTAEGCTSPAYTITSPVAGQTFSTSFDVIGTISTSNLAFYNLEVQAAGSEIANVYLTSTTAVENGVIGRIDPNLFNPGEYWIRIRVVDNTGNIPPDGICAIPIRFD